MDATTTLYTEEDVRAAEWAREADAEFHVQYDDGHDRRVKTAEDAARALAREFELMPPNVAVERYRHGKALLLDDKVITSHRLTTGESDDAYQELRENETIVSAVLRASAGHIATSEAHCYVALAVRKTPKKTS